MSRLQDEIKQSKPFPNLRAEALLSIIRTAAVINHVLNEALKPFGITMTQYNVLRILRGAEEQGLCGREIGDRLVSPVPDVTRLLDRMEEMKLLTRERSLVDRRYVSTHISDAGRALLTEVDPQLEMVANQRFDHLDAETLKNLITTLEALR
jgi:DNA-binding MarR family transcriptional regulator